MVKFIYLLLTLWWTSQHVSALSFIVKKGLPSSPLNCRRLTDLELSLRGGARKVGSLSQPDEDADDEEEEEEEEDLDEAQENSTENTASTTSKDEEEDEEAFDASLAVAAIKKVSKTKAKTLSSKVSVTKKAVNMELLTSNIKSKSTTSKSKNSFLRVPYVVKAFLNPFIVVAMTRAYWASLFNLDFLKKEQSQELRSAIEERNKRGPPAGSGGRGKRKMKRGQSKSLSDLPQLSA